MQQDRSYFGFLWVGFFSLMGGIGIFFFFVAPRDGATAVPRDVQLMFTYVYSQEGLIRNEKGIYTDNLEILQVDKGDCEKYFCQIKLGADSKTYEMVAKKDNRIWVMQSVSPVPKEIKVGN